MAATPDIKISDLYSEVNAFSHGFVRFYGFLLLSSVHWGSDIS